MANVGNAFENSCILTALGVVAILVNIAVITRLGRRRFFLMTGLLICGFSQLIVAAIYTVHPGTESTGKAIVGLSVIFILGYNVKKACLLVISRLANVLPGNDLHIRLGLWRRVTVSASAVIYIWLRGCHWVPWRGECI